MSRKHGYFIGLLVILAGIGGYNAGWDLRAGTTEIKSARHETALDRIRRTGIMRCGYAVWVPILLRDPNTGTMSGLGYDTMNVLARELDVKIEWTQEVGYGDYQEALNGGRIDVMCSPVWQSGTRAKAALLSKPLFYDALVAFAREDDHRFDQGLQTINQPDVRVAVIDGDAPQNARRTHFPKSQERALPQSADAVQAFMEVATNKADIVLDNYDNEIRFNSGAHKKLKVIAGGAPVQMFGDSLAVRSGEADLKAALDTVIDVLNNGGIAAPIVEKYGPNYIAAASSYATK